MSGIASAQQPAAAAPSALKADLLASMDDAAKKLVDLAQAVPADKYGWRPAPGVRSISEVYMHTAGGNFLIPTFIGVKAPEGIDRSMETKVTDKAQVIDMLKKSIAHVHAAVEGTPDADMDQMVKFFGRDMDKRAGLHADRQPHPRAPGPVDRLRPDERHHASLERVGGSSGGEELGQLSSPREGSWVGPPGDRRPPAGSRYDSAPMNLLPPDLPPDVARLVDQKKFEELEALFTRKVDESPGDLAFFFALAAAVKKKGSGAKALSWLKLLADYQASAGDLAARIRVLLEIARMSPTDAAVRTELTAALKQRYGSHPAFAPVLAQFSVEKAKDPSEVAGKIDRWLRFRVGDIYAMAGRGAGRIAEMNPALDVIRLEVGGARVPLSLVTAEKNLTPLPADHFLRQKVEAPEALRALSEKEPAETVRRMLGSFGRAMTVQEVRDHMAGLIEEPRWTGFWAAARRHPQLVVSGSGKSALVTWSESAGAAEGSVRREFETAGPLEKIEIARKNAKRSRDLAQFFAAGLASQAVRLRAERPGLAWELSQAARPARAGRAGGVSGRGAGRAAAISRRCSRTSATRARARARSRPSVPRARTGRRSSRRGFPSRTTAAS